jgi:hypothetical protein
MEDGGYSVAKRPHCQQRSDCAHDDRGRHRTTEPLRQDHMRGDQDAEQGELDAAPPRRSRQA